MFKILNLYYVFETIVMAYNKNIIKRLLFEIKTSVIHIMKIECIGQYNGCVKIE